MARTNIIADKSSKAGDFSDRKKKTRPKRNKAVAIGDSIPTLVIPNTQGANAAKKAAKRPALFPNNIFPKKKVAKIMPIADIADGSRTETAFKPNILTTGTTA